MCELYTAGSLWLADFSCEKHKEEILEKIKASSEEEYDWDKRAIYYIDLHELEPRDEAYNKACKITAIKYCLESGFACDILGGEEAKKCADLFLQRQYGFKLFKKLLAKFCFFLGIAHHFPAWKHDYSDVRIFVSNLFKTDIRRLTQKFREEEIEKSYAPLKRRIENIASGVKGRCYIAAEKSEYREYDENGNRSRRRTDFYDYRDIALDEALNESVKRKYGYDYNAVNRDFGGGGKARLNAFLCKILLDDNAFWAQHEKFDAFKFIQNVFDFNGKTHAEKIVFFIFDEICREETGKEFLKNSLPLEYLDRGYVEDYFERRTASVFFGREYFSDGVRSDKYCYPFSQIDNAEEKFKKGEQLALAFFKEIYPDDWQRVINYIDEGLKSDAPVFAEDNSGFSDKSDMTDMLDFTIARFTSGKLVGALKVYSPDFFKPENTCKRFFLKMYAMYKTFGEGKEFYFRTFENFYYLIDIFERVLKVNTAYQCNGEGRENGYLKLKELLARYGVNASDNRKQDYIVSLLDERVALGYESDRFAVLEQLGDAVYGFAVAENLFYNLYIQDSGESLARKFENFTRAEAQIEIARKIGLDKLYLSPSAMQGNEEFASPREKRGEEKEKYIADSLEMVIGAVCLDCGYESAIKFVKKILRETYSDKFHREIRWLDDLQGGEELDGKLLLADVESEFTGSMSYWTSVRPALYSDMESYLQVLWRALDKLVCALSVGTEEKEARKFITYSSGIEEAYGEKVDCRNTVLLPFYEYLQGGCGGLKTILGKYSPKIKEYYEKVKAGYDGETD